MQNLTRFLTNYRGKSLLAIFPHPDDASFVAGGAFQVLQEFGIKTKLVCLIEDKDSEELKKAAEILGIDNVINFKFKTLELEESKREWLKKIADEIAISNPDIILTFDPHGITGHPDHVATSIEILNLIKKLPKKPSLLWRVADRYERDHFDKGHNVHVSISPTHNISLSISQSFNKLMAIYSHKSKLKSMLFKMRVLEWYLFDHKEQYYLVNLQKDNYNLAIKKGSLLK